MSNCNNDMHEHVSTNLGYRYCPDCGMQLLADCESSFDRTNETSLLMGANEKLTEFKAIMTKEIHKAETEYEAAAIAYVMAIEEDRPSLPASNKANYWKGRRDVLQVFLRDHEDNQQKPESKL